MLTLNLYISLRSLLFLLLIELIFGYATVQTFPTSDFTITIYYCYQVQYLMYNHFNLNINLYLNSNCSKVLLHNEKYILQNAMT